MRTCSHLLITTSVLAVLVLAAAPAHAGGPDWFGLHIGSDGFGLSLGFGNWAPYGSSWNDPHWRVDYHSSLSGYGEWVYVSGLGQVWRPYVAGDWRPFNHGRWVYTSYGWTWVSYEPWGYFPHHYGSWAFTTFGWVWSPGYTYHPGNVVWVDSGGYVGWYACPPHGWSHAHRGFHHGSNQAWRNGYRHGQHDGYNRGYDDGYWDGWQDARYATFVTRDHLTAENLAHHALSVDRVNRTVTGTSVRPLQSAPSRSEVGRWSGRRVEEVRIEQRSVRTADREMTIARPQGIERSIERHGGETVDRALSRDVASRFKTTRGAMDRVAPAARERSVDLGRSAGRTQPVERQPSRQQTTAIDRSRTPQRSEEMKDQSRDSSRDLSRSSGNRDLRPQSTTISRSPSPTRVERSQAPTRSESSRAKPSLSDERGRSPQSSPSVSTSRGSSRASKEDASRSSRSSGSDRARSVQPSQSRSAAPQVDSARSSRPSVSRSTPSREQQPASRRSTDASRESSASQSKGSAAKETQSREPKRQRR